MKRRNFLQLAALTGMAVTVPSIVRDVEADEPFAGPFLVAVHAGGGWDPTLMFDPTLNDTHTRLYTETGKVGNIPFAPIPLDLEAINEEDNPELANYLMSNESFLNKFGGRLTVINGIDTTTNNHDSGRRAIWSGKLPEGYPSLGALVAATKAPSKPMAFVSGGGYDFTAGKVPVTRVGNTGALVRIARPNIVDVNDEDSDTYHTPDTWDRIARFQRERAEALQGKQQLPRIKASISELSLARAADNELTRLQLPDQLVEAPAGDLQNIMQQAQIAVAAFKAGIAVSANLNIGGFDTHGNHDVDQRRQQQKILGAINFLMDYAEAEGLGDKIIMIAGSDFGRTPYNDNDGKDHHPVTSVLAMGPGIEGNRVVGSTTSDRLPNEVDGVVPTPEHLQIAMRKLLGVDDGSVAAEFPIGAEDLNLFG